MKTDVPLFGSRCLGRLCNGAVCAIFDGELYRCREVRCWHSWPSGRMVQVGRQTGCQIHVSD